MLTFRAQINFLSTGGSSKEKRAPVSLLTGALLVLTGALILIQISIEFVPTPWYFYHYHLFKSAFSLLEIYLLHCCYWLLSRDEILSISSVLHIISSSLFGATLFTFFLYFYSLPYPSKTQGLIYLCAKGEGGGGGNPNTMWSIVHEPRVDFCCCYFEKVMFSWHLLILCRSGHMIAFFYAHHIFTWQPNECPHWIPIGNLE